MHKLIIHAFNSAERCANMMNTRSSTRSRSSYEWEAGIVYKARMLRGHAFSSVDTYLVSLK